jgi:mannose/fructose/N-acetylgalactosamine-specific phosphotransferase system component IIB
LSVALVRVDDRLLHGQVLLGWGCALAADRYLVVDDALAASPFESALVQSCGGDAEVAIVPLAEGGRRYVAEEARAGATVVLVRGIPEALALARAVADAGGRIKQVNLGGIHHAPGKERVHDFVYLGPEDRAALAALRESSVRVVVQDVPASTPFDAPPAWSARVA